MKKAILKIMFLILCGMTAATAQTVSLQLQNFYPLGTGSPTPRFAVGDFNNDGLPDMVTSTGIVGQPISVLTNNGAGGFALLTSFAETLNPTAVAVGDFNNDGNLDLAFGQPNNTNGVIIVRFGNGTGFFPTQTMTGVMQNVNDLAAADFNGDGNLDLAMTNSLGYNTAPTNAVRVIPGNGAGGFGLPTNYEVGSQPVDLEVADFNLDGRPDIAALAFATTNTVRVLLNNGAGFSPSASISWANATSGAKIVAADFNRDGAADLAAVRTDSIAIMLGDNAGNFSLSSVPAANPLSIAVGDFNLDRKIDLAIGRPLAPAGNLTILPGDGAGAFLAAFSLNLSFIPDNLAVLDVNLDGKKDLALSTRSNSFALYHGASNRFVRTENDFDADGKTDLGVFRPSLGDWFAQRSTQGFFQTHWGISTDKLVPADYDGDFKTDIAVWRESGSGNNAYFYILNSSDNTLRLEQFGLTGDKPTVGDWDGDGRADPSVYRDGAQSFFFYHGSLNNPNNNITYLPWGTTGDKAARGDFDGDGRQDAAVFRPSNGVWYVLNSSNAQARYQNFGLSADRPVAADYDGDGKTDVAVFRPLDGVWYVLNSATGTISYRQWGISSDALVPADYNGDGKAEPAIYRPSEQRWYIPPYGVAPAVNAKFGASGDVPVPAAP